MNQQNAESKLEQAIDIIKTLRQETTHVYGHCDPGAVQDCWNELQDIVSNWQSLTTPASNEEEGSGKFQTGVRDGINGWQAWFSIDHQTFYLQPVAPEPLHEEDTEEKARWYEKNIKLALNRLTPSKPHTVESDELTIDDYKEVFESHKELVRELDKIINGKNAAKQASLCDIVAQLKGRKPTVEAGQTQEPVGWMKNDKEDVIRNFIRFVSENEYFHVRSTYGEFWYKNGRKDTPSTDEFIKEYLHVPATPPHSPIKTEGEDAGIADYEEFNTWRKGITAGENTTVADLYNYWENNIKATPPSPVGIDVEAEAKKYAGIKVPLRVKDYSAATKRVYEAFKAGYAASLPQSSTEEENQLWIDAFRDIKADLKIKELKLKYKISKR